MNTFFFVRIRLGRQHGRRSFVYGPYVQFDDATRVLDYIPDILEGLDIECNCYTASVEEKHLVNTTWTKINTRFKLRVQDNLIVTESE